MADMYGNYDKQPVGSDRMQMARKMNDVAMAFSNIAKKHGYEGDTVEFGTYSTMFLMRVFGPTLIEKVLDDLDLFRVCIYLVGYLDGTDEMDEDKAEAAKIKKFLDHSDTGDIVKAIREMGGDQVDIDHILEALGRDEE